MTRKALWLREHAGAFVALAALLFLLVPGEAPVLAQTLSAPYVRGEILIVWQPGTGPIPQVQRQEGVLEPDRHDPARLASLREISRLTGLSVLDAAPEYRLARLATKTGQETAEAARLRKLPWVRYAELNYYAHATGDILVPNDPDYSRQWNMQRVEAPTAWAATRGSLSFVVAVLDTGVAQSHPEFAGKLLPGKDYVNSPDFDGPEDDDAQLNGTPLGHGTHVTGIIAAGFNNSLGVAGLAPDVKILPLKVLDSQRQGSYATIIQAIYDAANNRAQIINLSLAGTAPSQAMQLAITDVTSRGVLVVAAAGNCAQDIANCGSVNPAVYPAAYPGVLAVASSDRYDRATPYSGYKSYIGVAAPGGVATDAVWSTMRSGYGYLYGTSMSTPMVSAAAALVWTLVPAATPGEIADQLKITADKVGTDPYSGEPLSYSSGRNDYFGSGRLNAGRAVCSVYPLSLSTAPGIQSFLLGEPLRASSRTIKLVNSSEQSVAWQARVIDGAAWLSVAPANGNASRSAPGQLTLKVELGTLTPGIYVGVVRVEPLGVPCLTSFDIVAQLRVVESVRQIWLPAVNVAR